MARIRAYKNKVGPEKVEESRKENKSVNDTGKMCNMILMHWTVVPPRYRCLSCGLRG
jgi:hypothetical protein